MAAGHREQQRQHIAEHVRLEGALQARGRPVKVKDFIRLGAVLNRGQNQFPVPYTPLIEEELAKERNRRANGRPT